MTRLLILPVLLLTACPADDGDKSDDSADTATDGCTVTVESTPTNDSTNAYYRGNIEFELSAPDPTATITTDIPGTEKRNDDNTLVWWEPSAPLSPSTSYSATLTYCQGATTINFTTSTLGTPLSSPDSIVGNTYALDLANANIREPAGIEGILGSYLTTDILIGIVSADASEVSMLGAIGTETTPTAQDYCDPSIPFPTADFSGAPFFNIGPADTTLSVAGYSITIGDLVVNGTFASDGSYFGGGVLSGQLDTRPLDGLLSDTGEEGALCELASSVLQIDCQPCPTDNQPFCLTLVADQIQADLVDNLILAEIAGNDCTGCESWTFDTVPAAVDQECPVTE